MKNTLNSRWSVSFLGFVLWMAATVVPAPSTALDLSYLNYLLRIKYLSNLSFNLPARDLNGIHLNGQYLDDQFIVSVSLDDVRISRHQTRSLDLSGTAFSHAGNIVGSEFTATVDDGSVITLRVDAVKKSKSKVDRDVLRYFVSYDSDEGWKPLCGMDDAGAPIAAVPLSGRWDYSVGTETGGAHIADDRVFTFACEGYVLEKCMAAGYKPWGEVFVCRDRNDCEWVSLAPYHQACTRMLRADYCGDGTSYTEVDVLVALYDGLGIRVDTEEWNPEAEWDEDGAVCAAAQRIETLVPTCGPSLVDETCGDKSHFADGVRIISELP